MAAEEGTVGSSVAVDVAAEEGTVGSGIAVDVAAGAVGAMVGVGGGVAAGAQDITTRTTAMREMKTPTRLF
ncbi:MAG: hypothetical protein H8D74_01405 [Chloroflexi bacterium]|nr:hypothetical protein [Chloroflexota bacterium]